MKNNSKHIFTLAQQEVDHLKVIPTASDTDVSMTPDQKDISEKLIPDSEIPFEKKSANRKFFSLLILLNLSFLAPHVLAQSTDFAIDLDGLGDHYAILHHAALQPTAAITIEMWVNADNILFANANLYRKEDGNNRQLFAFQDLGTILSFGLNTGGVYAELDVPINAATFIGNWVHIAATYDGAFKRVYVNGTLVGIVAATGALPSGGFAPPVIGSFAGASEFFDGQIDELRMWSVARTEAEINASKDKRLSGGEANLELYLPFNEGAGLSTADLSVNAFTASHADVFKPNVAGWGTGKVPIYTAGAGTLGDPYQITDLVGLQGMRELLSSTGLYYRLMNDIDATPTSTWFDGTGFFPVGETSSPFEGFLLGDHRVIDGLFINRSGEDQVGLFGVIGFQREVKQVHLTNLNVTGKDQTGGFAGLNIGLIEESSVIGAVVGNNKVGVLAGENSNVQRYNYARGTVNGTSTIGGLIGINSGNQVSLNSYSAVTHAVSGAVVGVVGIDATVAGSTTSQLTANTFTTVSQYTTAGWDFANRWHIRTTFNDVFPFHKVRVDSGSAPTATNAMTSGTLEFGQEQTLSYTFNDVDGDFESGSTFQWFRSDDAVGTSKTAITGATQSTYTITSSDVGKHLNVAIIPKDGFRSGTPHESTLAGPIRNPFSGGSGTLASPYRISTLNQLQFVGSFLSAHFILINDIDASPTSGWNDGEGFVPIGNASSLFSGSLNGQGFSISGLVINRQNGDLQGLFGNTSSIAILSNIVLTGGSVTGRIAVGSLVGLGSGTVTNCYTSTNVTGLDYVGGLTGASTSQTTKNSHATGNVIGNRLVGGLIGNNSGTITNSYATGNVTGNDIVGGLVGGSSVAITNSYATGSVIGNSNIGGFSGNNSVAEIVEKSFWDTQSSGQNNGIGLGSSTGLTGKTTAELQDISTFTAAGWDFSTVWGIDPAINSGYPFLQELKGNNHVIAGDEGWRIMASPVNGASFGTLLNGLWTQGFTGASTTNGSPNVLFWDEATRSFTPPTSLSQNPGAGKGFLMYVFSDDDNDGTPDGFPKILSNDSSQTSGATAPALSFTNTGTLADDGWNLMGNPYGSTIHWNAPNGWTKTNLDATFYVWSDSASSGAGSYLSWNGATGTLPDGKIAPWQGFWVKANTANPAINFTDSVRQAGGTFFKRALMPQLKLRLEGNEQASQSVIMFHPQAELIKDPLDGYKLQSLNGHFLSLGTNIPNAPVMDIQALPIALEETLLELDIQGSDLNGRFTLSWDTQSIPDDWSIVLIDSETDEEYFISDTGELSFEMNNEQLGIRNRVESGSTLSIPNSPVQVLKKSKGEESRFALLISGGVSVSTDQDPNLPTEVTLDQNYPNPFNPTTNIRFALPQASEVRLQVFDLLGRKVSTLVNSRRPAGQHVVSFDARSLSSGIYIYQLQTGGTVLTRKMVLVK